MAARLLEIMYTVVTPRHRSNVSSYLQVVTLEGEYVHPARHSGPVDDADDADDADVIFIQSKECSVPKSSGRPINAILIYFASSIVARNSVFALLARSATWAAMPFMPSSICSSTWGQTLG
jgi:hypothetical protein